MSAAAQLDKRVARNPAPAVAWLCHVIAALGTSATIALVATAAMWASSSPGASIPVHPSHFRMVSTAAVAAPRKFASVIAADEANPHRNAARAGTIDRAGA
jgi:hypothetical protein